MKYFYTLGVFLICLSSCSKENNEAFEGVIKYEISIEFKKKLPYEDYLKQKYGGTMELFISKTGDYKQVYNQSGAMGFDFVQFTQESNEISVKYRNLDTLYWYNASENVLDLISYSAGNPETILGSNCKSIVIKSFDSKGDLKIVQTYVYDNSIPINPNLYKDHNDAYYSRITYQTKSHYMKLIMDYGDFVVTKTVINIQRKTVDKELFKLPSNIPKKYL